VSDQGTKRVKRTKEYFSLPSLIYLFTMRFSFFFPCSVFGPSGQASKKALVAELEFGIEEREQTRTCDDYRWLKKTGITGCTPSLSAASSGMDVQQRN